MLSPLALSAEPLLRVIQAGGFTTFSDLAAKSGRPRSNMARDLTTLEAAGLIERPATTGALPALTSAGADQLSAIDRANEVRVLHGEIEQDPLNPRRTFDEAGLAALADSIYDDGKFTLLQPLVIRRREGGPLPFRLVAGERRWRAIGLLIADGRWPADMPAPVSIRVMTDEEAAVLALVENMQREDLSPVDEALTFQHLTTELKWSTAEIAAKIHKTQEFVQQRLRVLGLPDEIQARMRLPKTDENRIGFKEARRMFTVSKETTRPKAPELSPKLALALLELAHKIESAPMILGEPGHTALTSRPVGGALATLHERKIISLREWGGQVFAKIQLYSSGALTYLEDSGFYGPKRDEVIWAARTAVMSPQRASEATRGGLYITPELNTSVTPEEAADTPVAETPRAATPPEPPSRARHPGIGIAGRLTGGLNVAYSYEDEAEHFAILCAELPEAFEELVEFAKGVVEQFDTATQRSDVHAGRASRDLMDACLQKLNGGTMMCVDSRPDSAGPRLRAALAAHLGEEPMWGQPGKFLLRVDGMTAAVVIPNGFSTETRLHAVELDAPFLSPSGYRCHNYAGSNYLPCADGASVATKVAMEMRELIARETSPIGDHGRATRAEFIVSEPWIAEALASGTVIDGDALIAKHRAGEAPVAQEANPVRPPLADAAIEAEDEDADEEALDLLVSGLRQALSHTLGQPTRWNSEAVNVAQLGADAVAAFMSGRLIDAVIALMGLYHRTEEEVAERLLRKAAEGSNRPEGQEPEAKLFTAAKAARDWMLHRYDDVQALPGIDDTYRDLSGALNDVTQAKKAEAPLLVLRPGDVVEKYPGGATAHRLLAREDGDERLAFRAQPIRNGKDYGKPAKLALTEVAAFAKGR